VKIIEVLKIMSDLGCQDFLIKKLSPNDNSKNQVYIGGEKGIQYLPFIDSQLIEQKSQKKNASKYIFRNILDYKWITETGVYSVPEAKVIFYPQYPESRFSGFLKGCKEAPREIIRDRLDNRFLILSFNNEKESFGYTNFIDEDFISFLNNYFDDVEDSTFFEGEVSSVLEFDSSGTSSSSRKIGLESSIMDIKQAINDICNKGWIRSKKLQKDGSVVEHNKPNAGGVTLESELGVLPNSDAAPDYKGWEIKQHSGRPVTLFTPEPDAGFYKENGIAEFIKKFGYPDRKGRENRFNFGGVHRVSDDKFHDLTKLKLIIYGYTDGNFTEQDGHIGLQAESGETVAIWTFTKLLQHWQRKHAKTCFVKSERKEEDGTYFYKYSPNIELGIESTFNNFLKSLEKGVIYYDPASKLFLEKDKWKTKARSQFRIKESELNTLYKKYIKLNVSED